MWKVVVLSIIQLIIVQVYSQCDPDPCSVNGECLELNGGGFKCVCDSGFTSVDCSQGK